MLRLALTCAALTLTLAFGAGIASANTASIVNYAPSIIPLTSAAAVPEPASLVLLGGGLLGVATAVRRRRPAQR